MSPANSIAYDERRMSRRHAVFLQIPTTTATYSFLFNWHLSRVIPGMAAFPKTEPSEMTGRGFLPSECPSFCPTNSVKTPNGKLY